MLDVVSSDVALLVDRVVETERVAVDVVSEPPQSGRDERRVEAAEQHRVAPPAPGLLLERREERVVQRLPHRRPVGRRRIGRLRCPRLDATRTRRRDRTRTHPRRAPARRRRHGAPVGQEAEAEQEVFVRPIDRKIGPPSAAASGVSWRRDQHPAVDIGHEQPVVPRAGRERERAGRRRRRPTATRSSPRPSSIVCGACEKRSSTVSAIAGPDANTSEPSTATAAAVTSARGHDVAAGDPDAHACARRRDFPPRIGRPGRVGECVESRNRATRRGNEHVHLRSSR